MPPGLIIRVSDGWQVIGYEGMPTKTFEDHAEAKRYRDEIKAKMPASFDAGQTRPPIAPLIRTKGPHDSADDAPPPGYKNLKDWNER